MKKQLSVLSFLVALVFAFLLFSTNSLAINTLAVENGKNYEDGEIIAESDSLYEPELTDVLAVENGGNYEDGEIIADSDTLYEPELANTLAVENSKNYEDGEIIASSDTLYEPNANITDTNNKDNTIIPSVLVYYTNFSSVQESRYYEEYTGGYWYKGTLNLKSVVASGNGWNATYSGTLTARVE